MCIKKLFAAGLYESFFHFFQETLVSWIRTNNQLNNSPLRMTITLSYSDTLYFGWMLIFPTHCKHPIYRTRFSYYRYQLSIPCCWWSSSQSNGSNNPVWCVNLCFIANEMVLEIMNVIRFLRFLTFLSRNFISYENATPAVAVAATTATGMLDAGVTTGVGGLLEYIWG